MRALVVLVYVTGCGRVGFDALSTSDASSIADAMPCPGGLVGYWPMEAADVAGATVHDRSGHGYDGTVTGTPAPTVVTGHVGDALAYASTGNANIAVSTLPLGTEITISLWFWRDDVSVDDGLIYAPAAPKYDLWLTRDPRCPGLCLCINTANGDCWGVNDASLVGRWVHLAAILRNGPTTSTQLFVDGQVRALSCVFGSCTFSGSLAAPFDLGGTDTYNWHGLLDDVRVYGRALSESEIATLYAGCSP